MDNNMRVDRKAKAMIGRMLGDRQMTPEGLAWLTLATDPFHDSEVSCSGYPDVATSRSLVQTFTQTVAVSKPPALGDVPWDCHTFFNPCSPPNYLTGPLGEVGRFYLTDFSDFGILQATGAGTGMPRFPSGVVAVPMAGGNTLYSDGSFGIDGLAPPINPLSGPYRLIAVGYEVVNTTAELYKQGSVTVYKSPSGHNVQNLVAQLGAGSNNSVYTEFSTGPPTRQADAALYPNSRTWEAKEGAYIIPTMNSTASYFLPTPGKQAGLLIRRGFPGTAARAWLPLTAIDGTIPPGGNDLLPFDVSGAIFTGLHPQTTLQITARYVLERVPSVTEPDLLVLTRVPCTYDPLVLEIYSRVMANMPVGVMVKENPLGEWFRDILNAVGQVAPVVGEALNTFIPGAGLVGRTVGSMANAGKTAVSRANVPASPQARKKKAPPQKQNPPGTGKRAQKKAATKKN